MKMQTVEEELKDLGKYRAALINIPDKIAEMEEEYGAIRAARTDGEPVTGGDGSGRELAMLDNIARRDELARDLEITRRKVERIDNALSAMPERERLLLDRCYIHGPPDVDRLCEELHTSQSSLYRDRREAIIHYAKILYGHITI